MDKHTPGQWIGIDPKTKKFRSSPWRVENDKASCTVSAPIKAGRKTVALVVTDDFDGRGELQANARLIAAAPELLDALTHLEYNARKSGAAMGLALDVARAAIFKATGQ